ncbi:MAG TPA: hypothetical protein V6D10_12830 [Trichocoleus sp.]|jgi:hypothetical protein
MDETAINIATSLPVLHSLDSLKFTFVPDRVGDFTADSVCKTFIHSFDRTIP